MKEIQSVTADIQHGRVTFRFVDDTEEVFSLREFVATASVKVKRGDVDKSAKERASRARAVAGEIRDDKARELQLLALTSEEHKSLWLREARNECESVAKKDAGAKRYEKYIAQVRVACGTMYANASR